jgi:hypothetical protein
MDKDQFDAMKFSRKHLHSVGKECEASWEIRKVGGDAGYHISCRTCGTWLQSGCVPECLQNVPVTLGDLRE